MNHVAFAFFLAGFSIGVGSREGNSSINLPSPLSLTADFHPQRSEEPVAEARGGSCVLPSRWEGSWFQSGVHYTINISKTFVSSKGRCVESDGEKFIVFNERENCYRCLVFHEKQYNVLQYKETFCISEKRSVQTLCSTISGDANLFSLFRVEAVGIDCPFRGSHTFTYSRGQGECRYPTSTLDSCIQPSRLIFNFQACPDVPGTESTVEELECLGIWKEGSSRYLLGLIQYRHPSSLEERFRCFVYERTKKFGQTNSSESSGWRISQSGDATCNGLALFEGSRTLTLRKSVGSKPCQFPSWLLSHMQWHTLDMKSTYSFESGNLRVSNSSDLSRSKPTFLTLTATCHQILENPTLDKVTLVLHTTTGCQSGYICTAIYKRDGHIVEVQMGNVSKRAEDACHVSNFDSNQLPYITLVSSTPEQRQCPYLGRFLVEGLRRDGRQVSNNVCKESKEGISLNVGCSSLDTLQFRSDCKSDFISEYSCHGGWEEMGVSYLITTPMSRASTSARRYCFVFREHFQPTPEKLKRKYGKEEKTAVGAQHGRILQFSSVSDSCSRSIRPGLEGFLAFNATSYGECNEMSGAWRPISSLLLLPLLFSSILN